MVIDYNLLVVRSESPFTSFKEFVDAAKAKPKGISVAGTSIGSTDQIQLVQIGKIAGIDTNYTAFNSGGEVLTNLLGGHVDAAMANPSEVWEQMRAGKVRALAITAPERLKDLPDVPTLKESGVDLVVSQFRGIAGPKDLPADIVSVLETGFKKVADSPEWKTEYLDKFQQINGFMGSEEFTKHMHEQYKVNETLFKELGLYKKT
jgi:putative tricarboxylic transport membrane protein